jgi:glycosyltransferase involved in cell wall biosynthesis
MELRAAVLAAGLGVGGAEKQLTYLVRELQAANVNVRVYSLTKGEHYDAVLQAAGLRPHWIGRAHSPILRLITLVRELRSFDPHILQSTHFFANLYVAIGASFVKAISVGSIRNDTYHELAANRFWGPMLLRAPNALVANSFAGARNALRLGVSRAKLHVLPNAIDLPEFDVAADRTNRSVSRRSGITAVTVARLVTGKRLERFIRALALAKQRVSDIRGLVVGEGPQKTYLQEYAASEGLSPEELQFVGSRTDVPSLMKSADMFVLTSDHEGCPNVLLEAMAGRLPVISTPAGDAGRIVQNGTTGFLLQFDDIQGISSAMVRLAESPKLRRSMGEAGRGEVEKRYSIEDLAHRLLRIYRSIARQRRNDLVLDTVDSVQLR